MVLGRREFSAVLLIFGAVISVYMVLLAGPTSAQNGGGSSGGTTGQQTTCSQDEELVETFTGTQDQITPQFQITGPEWRFIVEATATTEASGNVSVTIVFDADNPGFGFAFASVDPEFNPTDTESSQVIDGPGTFSLDIDANGASYEILVCQSANQSGGDRSTPEQSTPGQGNSVIKETIPNKPLPPTGGWPVYALVASFILAGAGLLGFRLVIWRGWVR